MPRGTRDPRSPPPHFRLQGCYPLWPAFPDRSTSMAYGAQTRQSPPPGPTTPPRKRLPPITSRWFGLFPLRSPLLRESMFSFSSSGYLDVSVPPVSPRMPMDSAYGDTGSPCRVSPFGHPRIKACLRLPEAFRSLPRPSSALSA